MDIKKRIIKPQAVHESNHHVEHGYSLSEVHRSIEIPKTGSKWKKFLAFAGLGLLVAVGYMDPGNWATDLAGGAQFSYKLLSVILISNILAILLQALALKLGIATGRDLAQECKDQYSKPLTYFLWFLAEIAIAATDHLRRADHRTGRGAHPLP